MMTQFKSTDVSCRRIAIVHKELMRKRNAQNREFGLRKFLGLIHQIREETYALNQWIKIYTN